MRTRLRPEARDESGIALVAVIILSAILMAMVGATATLAVNSLDNSKRDQDWNAALSAAEAGLDDYLYRLNRDSEYWQFNAANLPPDGNVAFSQWVNVPGSGNGQFRYSVDVSQLTSQGIIKVTASGNVNGVTRTIEGQLRRRNFLDYLYFTEYETVDPALYTGYPFSSSTAQALCAHRYWDTVGRHPSCMDITFITQDIIKGPLHTNDALLLSGSPQFQGPTTTSWDGTCQNSYCSPDTDRYRGATATPVFSRPGDPAYAAPLSLPPSNTAIRTKADPAQGGVGCMYTGPTRITLNSNGTMNVTSPLTKSSNCQTGNGVSLPVNGVIYVQSVPTSGDPNYTATCPVGSGNPLGYPVSGDLNTAQYGCFDGDAFVSGTLKGKLTVAAQDSIVITGNLTYEGGSTGSDILGLIADNYVEIYHPVSCSSWNNGFCTSASNMTGSLSNPQVYAAVLTIKHSFRVQSHGYGTTLGTLTVYGSLGQLYRGPVGTFSNGSPVTGYAKNYTYDQRLSYTSPPHYLDPVASAWGIKTWAECAPMSVPAPCV